MTDRPLTLFHSPNTRSTGVLILLEELGVPYTLHVLNNSKEEQRSPEFLAINPLGKVPTLRDGDETVTEQVAIFIHLADLFPAANLAPAINDPLRGRYLRWLAFYAASFEPALIDHAMKREPGRRAMSPYGDYDSVINATEGALAKGPYLLGERFSAADILWGTALGWTMQFKIVPERPVFVEYVRRMRERPASQRATAKDQELAAAQKG